MPPRETPGQKRKANVVTVQDILTRPYIVKRQKKHGLKVDREAKARQDAAVKKLEQVEGMCNELVKGEHRHLATVLLAAFKQEEDIKTAGLADKISVPGLDLAEEALDTPAGPAAKRRR